ncbi:cell envelope integrity protein TolA [Lysobacter sp. Root604]|uniref:cell envelope integrity protein TolA n=1 Tax=Lysobacter sp. Root604 TaxID=1736568 RepID=UPI0006FEB3BB|nr:cell envelope integrity protein TolA [Lysobacter sp. Root604]KRA20393.1 hypothetical protein ASD69_03355 [Lysobacter sp. Root604]
MRRLALVAVLGLSVGVVSAQERASDSPDPLMHEYTRAVQSAILKRWTRPQSAVVGQHCVLDVRQLPGGIVASVDVASDCEYDAAGRQSIMAATLKAQPLPYAGYESVFHRRLILKFVVQDIVP